MDFITNIVKEKGITQIIYRYKKDMEVYMEYINTMIEFRQVSCDRFGIHDYEWEIAEEDLEYSDDLEEIKIMIRILKDKSKSIS